MIRFITLFISLYSCLSFLNPTSQLCGRNICSRLKLKVDDLNTRVKLKEEIASPLRKLRYFLYISAIAGGGLGFVTTIPQVIFAVQDHSDKINDVLTNTAIDLGGVIGGIALWIRESKDEQKKIEIFTDKELKQENMLNPAQLSQREKSLSILPVKIQSSLIDANATRIVSLSDLQSNGKQNVVILAGSQSFIRDATVSARLVDADYFSSQNIMIIPVVLPDASQSSAQAALAADNDAPASAAAGSGSKGFDRKSKEESAEAMTSPFIALPVQVGC